MAYPRTIMLSAALALSVAMPAAAQDTKHVKWNDDGTVELSMDPEYGGVIKTTREELGALFGPGLKPFEGQEVTILSLDSGPKGGISGPVYAFRPIWEELTGAKLTIALTPISELYTKTFLDLRLREIAALERTYGVAPPLWLMTSHSTEQPIVEALGARLDGDRIGVFSQFLSLRLTPEGELFLDASGRPSEHAPGHGDLPEALQKSGLLARFVERGGRVVMVTNLDNLGGTLDPAIIGWHLAHGQPISSEVVEKAEGDRGGIPVRVDGALCVLEEFRIPASFDPASVRVFNTNVFHFDARVLNELRIPWTYFRVTKKVDDQPVIQFERLVNEVTSFLPSRYLLVPRSGAGARFLPVKDNEELARRRGEIELVARSRGML